MTTHRPEISYDDAMKQASMTAETYLGRAVSMIDSMFGDGYAKKNPSLISPLVQAQVDDFNTTCLVGSNWEIASKISSLAESICYKN